MAAEIIRIDVVEHQYRAERDGKIRKAALTPEEQRAKDEKVKTKALQKATHKRHKAMQSTLVYSSVAARKVVQVVTQMAGYQIENSYNRQIFQADLHGQVRRGQMLQNQKKLDKARIGFVSNIANMASTSVAGYAINPLLGHIMLASYALQLSLQVNQQYIEHLENMRQFIARMQKNVQESEYKRTRLITNTYQNRGVGR